MGKLRRRLILLGAVAAAVAVGGYCLWRWLGTPIGDVVVGYTPALEACHAAPEGFRFCVNRARQGTDGSVAYHLHGRGLDEHNWNDDTYYSAMVQQAWEEKGIRPPIVVTVSFGPTWILTPRGTLEGSGLLEVFRDKVLPAVEAETGPPRRRLLLGESMGGVNVLVAGLRLPDLFERVIALCPPIYDVSPFADQATLLAAAEAAGAEPRRALAMLSVVREVLADEAEWRAFSPFALVDAAPPPRAPAFALSAGLYDAFGAYKGAEAFVQRARARGWQADFHPLYGGHCVVDAQWVAEKLVAP